MTVMAPEALPEWTGDQGAVAVFDLPEEQYFAHPALSCSQAKLLLPPSTPAGYRWTLTHPRPDKAAFDKGHAAHQLILGTGKPIQRVHADSWRTNAAKAADKEARAAGATPLLVEDVRIVLDMAKALHRHPVAGQAMGPGRGRPEVSLFWRDDAGIDRRCRLDFLPFTEGRIILLDYKTTARTADGPTFAKVASDFNYHMQDVWYSDGIEAVFGERPGFVFVVQETKAPYLVNLVELDEEYKATGAAKVAAALRVFEECTAAGQWPGYGDDVQLVSQPRWADRAYQQF